MRKVLLSHVESSQLLFGPSILLKSKEKRGEQIIQSLCRIASTKKLGPTSLICENFWSLRKVLLNHAQLLEI